MCLHILPIGRTHWPLTNHQMNSPLEEGTHSDTFPRPTVPHTPCVQGSCWLADTAHGSVSGVLAHLLPLSPQQRQHQKPDNGSWASLHITSSSHISSLPSSPPPTIKKVLLSSSGAARTALFTLRVLASTLEGGREGGGGRVRMRLVSCPEKFPHIPSCLL